ncbi:phage tail protein [Paracoccus sp. PAR01]|uniref:phage tail protein n=1 Tax=Paracoccus sp. PAR01 TaxID=2769282 RepID=UPI00177CE759|nr:phage tail protein [Paracoccus sp. PAR01]MBD9528374.1 hypothetical protein [Paracoccus sp. PAR01]
MQFILHFLLTLIVFAGPVAADPITAMATFITSVTGGAIAGATATALAQMAFGIGANLLATVLGKAVAERPAVDVQFEVQLGDDTDLSFIVGDYATAGKRKYVGSWGKNTRYITEVIEFSALPVPGVQTVWFNDELGDIRFDQPEMRDGFLQGYPVKNFSEGVGGIDERDRCWIKFIDGTQTSADGFLISRFGEDEDYPWTAAMIGTGKAYAVLTYYYDPESMTARPDVLIQPQPLPMYDPRKDSSTGGSGSHRWGNRATYEPSRNPAVISYNIARGIYFGNEWVFGGKNLAAWRLPRSAWVAAMNACARSVTLASGATEPAYRCGLQIEASMTGADVLEEIGRAANMRFAETGGMLVPLVDLPGASVFSFTDGGILITEGQSYKPFNSLGDTYNAISATYPEPNEKWSTKDAKEFIHAAATAEDGGRYLPVSLSYPAAPYARQVQRLMRAQMQDFRRFRAHQFYLSAEAYALEPLDMVSWSSARNGYVNKRFIVESVEKTPGMRVLVSLREVDPGDYDWSSDFELDPEIVIPKPVRPWTQVISGFSASAVILTDSATRARSVAIRAWCDGDEVGVTAIRLQVRKAGETDASIDAIRPWDEPYSWHIHTVQQRTTYQIRAQLRSRLTARTQWTGWLTVTTGAIYLGEDDFVDGVTGLFESAGMKPTRDILDRSVPGNYVGELAWSRADSRLYRWNGTTWVHFIQESVQGILDQTAFAAGLRVPKVITGTLPATGQSVGDLVYRTNDGFLYRWNGTVWTAEVAANQIVGQLIAGQIQAGAIGAEQLAANAVSAKNLLVADFTNLIPDNQLLDRGSWSFAQGDAIDFQTTSVGSVFSSLGYLRFRGADAGANLARATSLEFPVEAGSEFHCQLTGLRTTGTTGQFVARLQFSDADGAFIGGGTAFFDRSYSGGSHTGAATQSASVVAPAGAVAARVLLTLSAGADGNWQVGTPIVRRKNGGELIIEGTLRGVHFEFETITGGLLATTGIITRSAQIDDAVIARAHIRELAVDTLRIADNAVTIPVSQSLSSTLAGDGGWRTANTVTFTMPYAGQAMIMWFASQYYDSQSNQDVGIRLAVDGSIVWSRTTGGLETDWLSMGWSQNLTAGSHTIRVDWLGENSNLNIQQRSLIVQGTMK